MFNMDLPCGRVGLASAISVVGDRVKYTEVVTRNTVYSLRRRRFRLRQSPLRFAH